MRIAVIGGGAAGMELACAVAHRLGNSSVTLLSGDEPVGANYPAAVQVRMQLALKRRNITVLQTRATGISATEITLSSGAQLACDVPILAIGAQAPGWLQGSGLALDEDGFITVDAFQRSTSHANVFACGDICTRLDRNLPRSGVYAVRAGPPLTKNLRAVLAGIEPSAYAPQHKSLNLLSCGNQYAIASWGSWSTEGKWVWKIKNHIDRGFVHRYSRSPV